MREKWEERRDEGKKFIGRRRSEGKKLEER